jgi:hypothetical protein
VDIGEKIAPVIEPLLEPGETLEGMCVGSRSGFMSGMFVVIAATDRRLIVQETDRKHQPNAEPISITPAQLAGVKVGGFDTDTGDLESWIAKKTSLKLTLKTTSGEKLKLMIGKAEGPLRALMGGETQEEGVKGLSAWLDRNAPSLSGT